YVQVSKSKIIWLTAVTVPLSHAKCCNDFLPTFGEKPEGWNASGKRVKRGLYRTAQGWLINADCNGAANIGRKVAMMLGLDLSGISRGDLSAPLRLKLWS
ncbi:hypothetical protein QUB14_14170, partial [Microcoleus sp. B3-D2]